ncbi:DUF4430 domain-containing protein [Ornithinibacillus contaminans]|uniref:DUF4430 domain-containing protein n=1 Tax=Ornithinibacillus contaminans TaxID=694055 RepID=UPI00064DE688|nr:DUF4430 domain-containing protein [Ornithinibacillus contaminans]
MRKYLHLIGILVVGLILLVGCTDEKATENKQENSPNQEVETEQQETITIQLKVSLDKESEVVEDKQVEVESGAILLDVMKQNFEIEETDGYITSIEGINDDSGELKKAWLFYINGEFASKGASETELSDGDEVLFDFQSWE